jgi:hypothetical protein
MDSSKLALFLKAKLAATKPTGGRKEGTKLLDPKNPGRIVYLPDEILSSFSPTWITRQLLY